MPSLDIPNKEEELPEIFQDGFLEDDRAALAEAMQQVYLGTRPELIKHVLLDEKGWKQLAVKFHERIWRIIREDIAICAEYFRTLSNADLEKIDYNDGHAAFSAAQMVLGERYEMN